MPSVQSKSVTSREGGSACRSARRAASVLALAAAVSFIAAGQAAAVRVPLGCGYNFAGQVGNGTLSRSVVPPAPIVGLPVGDIVEVDGGYNFSAALMADGTVWTWGDNGYGQLGTGGTTPSTTAVPVSGLAGIVDISVGGGHVVALRADGTVWAWGNNTAGQCGSGSTVNQLVPIQARDAADPSGFLSGVSAVSAGSGSSYALKADGTVRAWGINGLGELGIGAYGNKYTAVPVVNLAGVTAISAGDVHAMALREDGSVWTWGYNGDWQIGDNNQWSLQRYAPVQVVDLTDPTGHLTGITAVAAGGSHCLALKADGTLRAWGKNHYWQLGNPGYYRSLVPIVVLAPLGMEGPFTDVVAIAGGGNHSLAIRADGSGWVWGANHVGQLGILGWSHSTRPFRLFPPATDATEGTVFVGAGSSQSFFIVDILNRPPVADAGPDKTAILGSSVYLDGSGSRDPDPGDYVLHSWEVVSAPAGSTAVYFNMNSQGPHFVPDVPGTYVFRLVVTDSHGAASAPDEVSVSTLNVPPVAVAGGDQTVGRGAAVVLDGSGSYDLDPGDTLQFSWLLASAPAGSAAALEGGSLAIAGLVPDLPGDYRVVLVVTDGSGAASEPVEVFVHAINQRPVADAGPDQAVLLLGSPVPLDGTRSWDGDNDPVTYAWSFLAVPDGSAATLSEPTSATPVFEADVHGDYVLQLVVSDGWEGSEPDTVTVSFANVPPVADAGDNGSVTAGDTVILDGGGSYDANADPIGYSWSLAQVPEGSAAVLSDPWAVSPGFVADLPGTYVATLVVNDGLADSDMSSVTVTAVPVSDALLELLRELISRYNGLDDADYKNANMRGASTNKVNAVISQVIAGAYGGAHNQLANDLLGKTDGCATMGQADNNDWIVTCTAQEQIYPLIVEVLGLLERLL